MLRRALVTCAARGATADALAALLARRTWARYKSTEEDSHDDFKPVTKGAAAGSVHEFIAQDVAKHPVLVFMKGTPTAPQCGFSNMVCRILDSYGVEYASRNVLQDPELREGIKTFTSWPTIPQVFVGGEFVGGSDILMSMHSSGELKTALQKLKQ